MTITDLLVERLVMGRKWTESLLADIEESRWFEMPCSPTGHIAWQIGHLAASQIGLVHHRCAGRPLDEVLPEGTRLMFGRGSTPVADSTKYPPISEIRSLFVRTQREVIDMVRNFSAADLESPAGTEPHPMFSSKAGAISMAAMHETFHAGQIAMLRRAFGKAALR
ncbi:MAG: DinB family protein [Phycisphaerae bacterium]|nr:DinB family protein [Phycisphaerae bacterium]